MKSEPKAEYKMKSYCDVCKRETCFYDAFGKDDISVVCVECKAPKDRKEVKRKA